jgi:cholesterol transport system auxiliary component
MKPILGVLLALSLAACGLAGPQRATTWYVLDDLAPAVAASADPQPAWPGALLVMDTQSPGFYEDSALAYSRTPGTRGHYRYARLLDLPAQRATQLMRQRLERMGLFQTVAAPGAGIFGRYQLNTRLLDFYHDASQPPGAVRLVLEVELVSREDARRIAQIRIDTRAPTPSADATGAAKASSQALTQALDQLVAWLQALPRPSAQK